MNLLNKGSIEYDPGSVMANGALRLLTRIRDLPGLVPSVLGLLLARAVVGDGLMPFAIPFFAAFAGGPLWLPAALSLGHLWSGSSGLIWLLLPMIPIYFIRIRAPTLNNTAVALMAVAGQMFYRLPIVVSTVMVSYDWMLYVLEMMLVATSALIFCQARDALRHKPNGAEGFERTLCLAVTSALALTSLAGLYLGPVAILPLLSIWIVLLVAVASQQPGLAAATGIVAGVLVAFGNPSAAPVVATLALAGLVAGLFAHWGKLGAVVGFATGALAMIIYAGIAPGGLGVLEIVIACGALALTPKVLVTKIKRLTVNQNGEWAWEYQQRLRRTTVSRLQRLGQVFNRLSHAFTAQNGVGDLSVNQSQMSALFDHVASEVCVGCIHYRRCWEQELYSTYSQLLDYLVTADCQGEDCDMEGLLPRRCHNLERLLGFARSCYANFKNERNWSQKVQECKGVVSDQLRGVADVIGNLSRQIRMDVNGRRDLEADLARRLTGWGLVVHELSVSGIERNLPRVDLRARVPGGENPLGALQALVSDVIGQPLILSDHSIDGDISSLSFTLPIKFDIDMGVAQYAREEVNGDCFTHLTGPNGSHVYMLSDGMGKGQRARSESNQALLLARDMLDAGFSAETAIKAINSLLVLRQGNDTFATMDMAVLDSAAGTLELYKTGAASSYIKSGPDIVSVSGTSLPIGIVPGVEPQLVTRTVTAGDYLVLVSDGVIDGQHRDEAWIINQLKSVGNIGAKTMANQLLNRAAKRGNQLQDDATVVVVRLKTPKAENAWNRYQAV